MWNLFRSKAACPIDPEPRAWVDERFRWLEAAFGRERMLGARVILPTEAFFPDPYAGRAEDVQVMMGRVAGYMGVDAGRLELVIFSDEGRVPQMSVGPRVGTGPAGVYFRGEDSDARATIGVAESQLADPVTLVATLAHEIGHELLLGEGRVSADEADHEPLTDLLTVFLGLGVFTGNSTVQDRGWSDGMWAGWHTRRLGYLDQRAFEAALAKGDVDAARRCALDQAGHREAAALARMSAACARLEAASRKRFKATLESDGNPRVKLRLPDPNGANYAEVKGDERFALVTWAGRKDDPTRVAKVGDEWRVDLTDEKRRTPEELRVFAEQIEAMRPALEKLAADIETGAVASVQDARWAFLHVMAKQGAAEVKVEVKESSWSSSSSSRT